MIYANGFGGANTAAVNGSSPATAVQILDPNQYVPPNYVQYHVVDKSGRTYTGLIAAETATGITLRRESGAEDTVLRYVVEKGSIAVDGVSLTVAAVDDKTFDFALIPHTATVTTLGIKGPGDPVNLEVDLVAKYVERLMSREG